eukprot:scaffold102291_cov18-Tisochrysis_lutea.AAC.1
MLQRLSSAWHGSFVFLWWSSFDIGWSRWLKALFFQCQVDKTSEVYAPRESVPQNPTVQAAGKV